MLTGDLNVVVAEWIVQYKIKDAYKFLFKMRDTEATFRDMNEAVVRRVIGDNAVDDARFYDHALSQAEVFALTQLGCPTEGDTTCAGLTVTGPPASAPASVQANSSKDVEVKPTGLSWKIRRPGC